jgi:transposase
MVVAESLGNKHRQKTFSKQKAIVALARRLAVIMHRIGSDGTEFRWSKECVRAAS